MFIRYFKVYDAEIPVRNLQDSFLDKWFYIGLSNWFFNISLPELFKHLAFYQSSILDHLS